MTGEQEHLSYQQQLMYFRTHLWSSDMVKKTFVCPSGSQLCVSALPERQGPESRLKISTFSCHHSAHFTLPTSIHTEGSDLVPLWLHPSIPAPSLHHPSPHLFAFFLWDGKVIPSSSEIRTGRCKMQINVIKCLCYREPSHRSGWLAPWLPPTPPHTHTHPPNQHRLAALFVPPTGRTQVEELRSWTTTVSNFKLLLCLKGDDRI